MNCADQAKFSCCVGAPAGSAGEKGDFFDRIGSTDNFMLGLLSNCPKGQEEHEVYRFLSLLKNLVRPQSKVADVRGEALEERERVSLNELLNYGNVTEKRIKFEWVALRLVKVRFEGLHNYK